MHAAAQLCAVNTFTIASSSTEANNSVHVSQHAPWRAVEKHCASAAFHCWPRHRVQFPWRDLRSCQRHVVPPTMRSLRHAAPCMPSTDTISLVLVRSGTMPQKYRGGIRSHRAHDPDCDHDT